MHRASRVLQAYARGGSGPPAGTKTNILTVRFISRCGSLNRRPCRPGALRHGGRATGRTSRAFIVQLIGRFTVRSQRCRRTLQPGCNYPILQPCDGDRLPFRLPPGASAINASIMAFGCGVGSGWPLARELFLLILFSAGALLREGPQLGQLQP